MSDMHHADADDGGSEQNMPAPGKASGNEAVRAGVGYRRPPEATRFKKGQSGNPSGRPRKSPSIQALVERELDQTVAHKMDGKSILLTKRELVAKAVVSNMLQGNMRTIDWFEAQAAKHPESLTLPEDVLSMLEDVGKCEAT
jgi:hypothetical protein